MRWPTTSRPSRTQLRRRSSRLRLEPSSAAARSAWGALGETSTSSRAPVRRAKATNRANCAAGLGGDDLTFDDLMFGGGLNPGSPAFGGLAPGGRLAGGLASSGIGAVERAASRPIPRSNTRTSTARDWSSVPAIASAWAKSSGTRTASHSRLTPRATASTGSRLRGRSIQAASEPTLCAPARVRSASVVTPLEPVPSRATVPVFGSPPSASSASSSANPVGMAAPGPEFGRRNGLAAGRFCASSAGCGRGRIPGQPSSGRPARSGRAARASDPNTSVPGRGAAAPHRSRRLARAREGSGRCSIGRITIEHLF